MATGEAPEAEENQKENPQFYLPEAWKNQPEGWKLPKAAAISQRKARLIRWKCAKPTEARKTAELGMNHTNDSKEGHRGCHRNLPTEDK